MQVERFIFNSFQENTYVVWDEKSGECVIIDAGNYNHAEGGTLVDFIEQKGLKPVVAVNTHGHVDHILGVDFVMKKWGIPWFVGVGDEFLVKSAANQGATFGLSMGKIPDISHELPDGDNIYFGGSSLRVISTPGHTPGHRAYLPFWRGRERQETFHGRHPVP